MNKYEITFLPLAKAPKGTFAVMYTVYELSPALAEQSAVLMLVDDGVNRSHFKSKVDINVVENDVVAPPAAEPQIKELSPGDEPKVDLSLADKFENLIPDKIIEPVETLAPAKTPKQLEEEAFSMALRLLNQELEALLPGVVLVKNDLSNELYHASNGVSCSKLKLFLECPAKYKAKYIDCVIEETPKTTFDLGTAVHIATLEPHLLAESVVCQAADIKVRNGSKWEAFKEANPGKLILAQKNYDLVAMANAAVNNHPFAARMIKGGRAEVSIFKRDEQTGLIIKCRPDYMLDDLIVDVKTAASAEPKKLGMDAKKFGYHMQDAMYRDISGAPEFAFLVIENKPPCVVTAPVLMDDEVRRLGYLKYRDGLQRLKVAIETNTFENYTRDPVVVGLSTWERKELEELELNGVAA